MNSMEQTSFSQLDHTLLNTYCSTADAVAALVGSHCEVVVHSLEDLNHSVIKVINGSISGRSVGAPLTNLAFDFVQTSERTGVNCFGPYYSLSVDGKKIRSVTNIIRGENNRIIGLICFNMDLSVPFYEVMQQYIIGEAEPSTEIHEIFPHTVEELINHMLDEAIVFSSANPAAPVSERNASAIRFLTGKGVFQIKNAVDIVAHGLGISRTSVYNYLREIKEKDMAEDPCEEN